VPQTDWLKGLNCTSGHALHLLRTDALSADFDELTRRYAHAARARGDAAAGGVAVTLGHAHNRSSGHGHGDFVPEPSSRATRHAHHNLNQSQPGRAWGRATPRAGQAPMGTDELREADRTFVNDELFPGDASLYRIAQELRGSPSEAAHEIS
jgi:hypothetical protein